VVSADDEILHLRCLDLKPVVAPRSAIFRFAPLRDDSFETRLRDGLEEILASPDDMIAITNRPLAAHELMKNLLACFQRHRAQIETIEGEQNRTQNL